MFRPIRALKAMTAAGALALAAAPAPAAAALFLVEGDNAVAIDFTVRNVPYYRFLFSQLGASLVGFDSGDTFEFEIKDSNGVVLGTTTTAISGHFITEERDPPVTPAVRSGATLDFGGFGPADLRAVLKATGGSSFQLDDTYSINNICAQETPTTDIPGGQRRRCHTHGEAGLRVSALNLAPPPPPPPPVGGVPEPTTWALMIGGFGAVGAMLRRRRSTWILA